MAPPVVVGEVVGITNPQAINTAPGEQTPLIQVVTIQPRRRRYRGDTLRQFCTIALSSILIALLILFLLPYEWSPGHRRQREPRPKFPWTNVTEKDDKLSLGELRRIFLETPDPAKAEEWSKYYTSGPHLAGKNLSQAEWTRDRWLDFGVDSAEVVAYEIYINYPVSHRLALLEPAGKTSSVVKGDDQYKLKHEFNLEEDVLEDDPTTALDDRIPTFHGYSANGNVTAQYVFVNFGTYQDFEDLVKANVSLEGKIAVAKYGRIFRGLKVKRAQELGMVGAVLYDDPQEDGEIVEKNGYKPYPEGPARNPSAIQRGSVQFLSLLPGDPTTPGYPSLPGAPRTDPSYSTPSIPSLPISYGEAITLLKALNGHGPKASDFNQYWQGGRLASKGVEYNIGPSPPELVLNLVNEVEYVTTPLWNTIGVINGTISDEVIVMGNHRDAWIAGGAGDPNSGSSALNEVIRSMGVAMKAGWKPLRTIVFASWDGEEYGLLGSTEWVEQYVPWLKDTAVAYINCDVGARGPHLSTSASPLLNQAIYSITDLVQSPNQSTPGQTVRDVWNGHISTMGSGSDFTAFQDFAGIPSVDIGFAASNDAAVYHYHSNYDSFYWMSHYGDVGFKYHVAIAKILALLAIELVESPILALNTTDYAKQLGVYLDSAKKHSTKSTLSATSTSHIFAPLEAAVVKLLKASIAFEHQASTVAHEIKHSHAPWWKLWHKARLFRLARRINRKYRTFEQAFLYDKGLDGREWFKHVVFAPGRWTGYAGATFPGLIEALDDGDKEALERWASIVGKRIDAAAKLLTG